MKALSFRGRRAPFVTAIMLLTAVSLAAQDQSVRRFGFFVGANDGGSDRVTLRYALSDAERVAGVMNRVGGIDRTDMILLSDPQPADVRATAEGIAREVGRAKGDSRRVELLFYYSGHSDERGLLLGESRLLYEELRTLITNVDADVSVAILDSCSSGSFTRLKGGWRSQPFLVNDASDMSGHAFLTSSSDNEASQESDAIGASFFTHYLVSGLLGAADTTNDRLVTLNEVYQYAFTETLSRTAGTYAGPQHPSYDIQLSGAGDLVLTDLSQRTAAIVLEPELAGRVYVRNATGQLVAELEKFPQKEIRLSIEPGAYGVELITGGERLFAELRVAGYGEERLVSGDFDAAGLERTRSRGDESTGTDDDIFDEIRNRALEAAERAQKNALVRTETTREYDPLTVDIFPGLRLYPSREPEDIRTSTTNVAVGIPIAYTGRVNGAAASYILNFGLGPVRGAQYAGVGNIHEGVVRGVQSGGVFNLSDGDVIGVQSAGVINILDENLRGLQAAGVANLAGDSVTGAQFAGVFNMAGTVAGVQASLVNVLDNGSGVQLGLVNLADELAGGQIGLVNIADDVDGVTFGLLNVIRFGVFDYSLAIDDAGIVWNTLQHGTRGLYTVYQFGIHQNDLEGEGPDYFSSLGFGSRVWGGAIYLDVELLAKTAYVSVESEAVVFPSARISGGLQLGRNFAVFGGVSFDGKPNWYSVPETPAFSGNEYFDAAGEGFTVYPHTFFGIKF